MEQNDKLAAETKLREVAEDTKETVYNVVTAWWREGRLSMLVTPIIAVVDPTGITVLLSDGRRMTIPLDAPDRARLEL